MTVVSGAGHINTRLAWSFIAAVAAADALVIACGRISVAPSMFLSNIAAIAGMLGLSYVYRHIRTDARIAALAHMGAATLAFSAAAAVLSYVTAAWARPLIDPTLVATDKMLGLDWLAVYDWVAAKPKLQGWLMLIYWSLAGQMILLLLALNFLGRIRRGWETFWLYALACVIAILIAAFWPAAGAFAYFHVNETESYVRAFAALRDGTLTALDRHSLQGIVQFPSLHAAWAIVFVYAARGVRWLFPLLLIDNTLILLATPAIGGHHFADLWAGAVLALVTILAVRKMAAAGWLPEDVQKT